MLKYVDNSPEVPTNVLRQGISKYKYTSSFSVYINFFHTNRCSYIDYTLSMINKSKTTATMSMAAATPTVQIEEQNIRIGNNKSIKRAC